MQREISIFMKHSQLHLPLFFVVFDAPWKLNDPFVSHYANSNKISNLFYRICTQQLQIFSGMVFNLYILLYQTMYAMLQLRLRALDMIQNDAYVKHID